MVLLLEAFKDFLSNPFQLFFKPPVYSTGPNTLDELLKQFDQPQKEKTQKDHERDYLVKEMMAKLEIEMLRLDPSHNFMGRHSWAEDDKKVFTWVPCVVRPEVVYCSYGKS